LKESKESQPIYIAVDATNLVRCRYCGLMDGDRWLRADRGQYCSMDCMRADNVGLFFFVYLIGAAGIPFFLLYYGMYPIIAVFGALIVMTIGFPLLRSSYLGLEYRSKVPRYSRQNERPSGVDLLKALPSRVSCPNCDANIDLEKVSADMVYTCDYCGASGNIEILKQE
jgi:DNA-directed RNA polymerase subunit RPC12/RpoP